MKKQQPMIDFAANMRYFHPWKKGGTVAMLIVGLVLAAAGIVLSFVVAKPPVLVYVGYGVLGLGALLAVIAVVSLILHAVKCPSDAKIDATYQRLADNATKDALERAGLDATVIASGKPVVLSACIYEDIDSQHLTRIGRDGMTRSSNFANFVLLFDTDQIIVYRNRHSIIFDEWSEELSEYFYSDIVNLSTEVIFTRGIRQEKIKLMTSAGKEIELPFRDNTVAEQAILTIRKALRAAKHHDAPKPVPQPKPSSPLPIA